MVAIKKITEYSYLCCVISFVLKYPVSMESDKNS